MSTSLPLRSLALALSITAVATAAHAVINIEFKEVDANTTQLVWTGTFDFNSTTTASLDESVFNGVTVKDLSSVSGNTSSIIVSFATFTLDWNPGPYNITRISGDNVGFEPSGVFDAVFYGPDGFTTGTPVNAVWEIDAGLSTLNFPSTAGFVVSDGFIPISYVTYTVTAIPEPQHAALLIMFIGLAVAVRLRRVR
ncbi:MAG: hypothetical protein AAGA45_06355 [Verrucomicrobiota bacterium]